jgi:Transposase DDE domain
MVTPLTFLTQLYVMVDDFCQSHLPPELHPGPAPALCRSEVLTLALFAQWAPFTSERAFYRYATRRLRAAFPALPNRSQFNRQCRRQEPALVAFALFLIEQLAGQACLYEALDSLAVPTRYRNRRGRGWLAGQANRGWSNRLGWYEGFRLLLASNPAGVVTGFGFGPASSKDQPLAESFFALRQHPDPRLPSVGAPARGPYLADKGFYGRHQHHQWQERYAVTVICAPQRHTREQPHPWPKEWRRWLAGLRQIVETVNEKLLHSFRLERERPHTLAGFRARLAAMIALHNYCIWLNLHLGRPRLAFADLIDW